MIDNAYTNKKIWNIMLNDYFHKSSILFEIAIVGYIRFMIETIQLDDKVILCNNNTDTIHFDYQISFGSVLIFEIILCILGLIILLFDKTTSIIKLMISIQIACIVFNLIIFSLLLYHIRKYNILSVYCIYEFVQICTIVFYILNMILTARLVYKMVYLNNRIREQNYIYIQDID